MNKRRVVRKSARAHARMTNGAVVESLDRRVLFSGDLPDLAFPVEDAGAFRMGILKGIPFGSPALPGGPLLAPHPGPLNVGSAPAKIEFDLVLSGDDIVGNADDLVLATYRVDPTPGYYWKGAVLPADLAPGSYRLFYVADPHNEVIESREDNNVYAFDRFDVAPAPTDSSLSISDVRIGDSDTLAVAGGSIDVSADVDSTAYGGSAEVEFYLSRNDIAGDNDDIFLGKTAAKVNGPGENDPTLMTVTLPADLADGEYHLVAGVVGGPSAVGEATAVYAHSSLPDYTFDHLPGAFRGNMFRDIDGVFPGSQYKYLYDGPMNIGGTEGSVRVEFVLSLDDIAGNEDDLFISDYVFSSHDQYIREVVGLNLRLPDDLAPGTYNVYLIIDPDNVVEEAREDNNVADLYRVTISPITRDMRITSITADPAAVSDGFLRVGVKTEGLQPGRAPVALYLSRDDVFDERDIYIGSGYDSVENFILHLPADLASGDYRVIGVYAADDRYVEIDKSNNVFVGPSVTVTYVGPPRDSEIEETPVVGGYTPITRFLPGTPVPPGTPAVPANPSVDPVVVIGTKPVVKLGISNTTDDTQRGRRRYRVYLSADGTFDDSDIAVGRLVLKKTLNPSDSADKRVRLRIPEGLTQGSYTYLLVDETSNRAEPAVIEAGLVSAQMPVRDVGVDLVDIRQTRRGGIAEVIVTNSGNVRLHERINLDVRGSDEQLSGLDHIRTSTDVLTRQVKRLRLDPGETRTFRVRLGSITPGTYEARVQFSGRAIDVDPDPQGASWAYFDGFTSGAREFESF